MSISERPLRYDEFGGTSYQDFFKYYQVNSISWTLSSIESVFLLDTYMSSHYWISKRRGDLYAVMACNIFLKRVRLLKRRGDKDGVDHVTWLLSDGKNIWEADKIEKVKNIVYLNEVEREYSFQVYDGLHSVLPPVDLVKNKFNEYFKSRGFIV